MLNYADSQNRSDWYIDVKKQDCLDKYLFFKHTDTDLHLILDLDHDKWSHFVKEYSARIVSLELTCGISVYTTELKYLKGNFVNFS